MKFIFMASDVVSSDCGYKLFKAVDGSNMGKYCQKCKAKMIIEIRDGKITIQKVLAEKA